MRKMYLMKKKYEITEEFLQLNDMQFHQIRALKDFGNVKKGDLGGYVQHSGNLSQEGECWISKNAKVYGDAKIYDNAIIEGNVLITNSAKIHDNAFIYNGIMDKRLVIYDNAEIYGNTHIFGNGKINGNVKIFGNTLINAFNYLSITDSASIGFEYYSILLNANLLLISKNAKICGCVGIYEQTLRLGKNALIKNSNDVIVSKSIGSRPDRTTFYRGSDGLNYALTGCFNGTLDELTEAVNNTHKNNYIYRNEYLNTIDYAKKMFDMYKKK